VHFCGETDEENTEPDRRDRIAALLIAKAISRVARRTITVVDEADDLLFDPHDDDGFGRRGSKVFMNRLLERGVAPTIWIVNDIDRLGPSIIRHMNLAVRFSKSTFSVRRTMIAHGNERRLSTARKRDVGTRTSAYTPCPHRERNPHRQTDQRVCKRCA
jgi:hypothetical protein